MENFPKVSIITATYYGDRTMEKYLKGVLSQDYPQDKIEILIADGGSKDKTIEIAKDYAKKYKNIKFMHNKKRLSEGKGMGKDMLTRKAKGEIIAILDQDNILIQKDWLRKIVEILTKNHKIHAVQSKMFAPKPSSALDRYLNGLGIEDPFATSYSLNAQVIFNPEKFDYNKKGEFYIYNSHPNNFLYAGGDGFVIWKKHLMAVGGYTQDIDNFYRMALKKYKIAIPKNIKLHHNTSTEFFPYLKKRGYFVQHFMLENTEDRDFEWISKKNGFWQNFKFLRTALSNMLIIPGLIQGIERAVKEKEKFWLIHPFMLFIITSIYIYSFFYVKVFKKIGINYK